MLPGREGQCMSESDAPAEGRVVLPPEAGATSGPSDPGGPESYTSQDYQMLLEEHAIQGMSAGELAGVFPDASYVIHTYGGNAFQEHEALGNDPMILRALGKLGRDMWTYESSYAKLKAEMPAGARVDTPPLTEAQLEREIQNILTYYVD